VLKFCGKNISITGIMYILVGVLHLMLYRYVCSELTSYSLDFDLLIHSCIIYYKAIPLRAWTGSEGSRSLKLPISRQLAQEGHKVVSPTHWPPVPPGNIPGTHFCWRMSQPQGHWAAGRIMSMKKSNDTIGNGTRNLIYHKLYQIFLSLPVLHRWR